MIDKKMTQALNEQINKELYSAYLYLSMAAYFDANNLSGLANWMRVQAQEETEHAMKFYHYIYERGGQVTLTQIDAPETKWKSVIHVFETTLAHEQKVTKLIHSLVDLAIELNDHATNSFLKWYVDEQVEEESSADEILQQLLMIKDNSATLLMLDKEMAKRSAQ